VVVQFLGFISVLDERVIISKEDWLSEKEQLEVNRIIYGWSINMGEPVIVLSEKNEIKQSDRESLAPDGLMDDETIKELVDNIGKGQSLKNNLEYPNSWLTACIPPDASLMQ